ncbi:MAG TPA: protein-glutamate O-methyltransferase CheR [Kofleriaceae bacterium]|jgi:chemotaxis protein methyltransferase CheR
MSVSITSDDITRLIELVEQQLGIALEPARATAMLNKRGVRAVFEKAAREPAALRQLVSEIVIGETYFFRHAEQMAAVRDVVMPERLAASGDAVRVLSAGCSSGEEPYSLAMIAHDAQKAQAGLKRIEIEGVDASEAALEKARAARYTRWSLRGIPPELERRWFTADGATLQLSPTIRDAVKFRRASLLDPLAIAVGMYDLVFCRNVLIYFTPQALAATVERLSRALAPGGYLFLGHSEILRHAPTGLGVCESHGTFYYRRGEGMRAVSSSEIVLPNTDTSWFTAIGDSSERVKSLADRASSERIVQRDETREAVATARAAIAREQYALAITALEKAEANDPDVVLLRAVALTELGEAARAAQACEVLLTTAYTAHASYLLAVGAESAGEVEAATRYARAATEAAPGFAMAHLRYGLLARRTGELDVAKSELARAVVALGTESADRLALHAGGLGRDALTRLARGELAAVEAT